MPFSKSKPKAGRVVRVKRPDGSVKEYRYGPHQPKRQARHGPDSVGALSTEWRKSPEWLRLAPVTRSHYLTYIQHLERLATLPVAAVKRRDIMEIRDAVAAAKGPGAATAFVRVASAAFRWALDRGWIEHSPCTMIRPIPSGHLPAWTEAQIAAALDELPEYLRRAVLLALHTGQRRGDLVRMTWAAYDGRAIRLVQGKTGAALVIPAHPTLKAELDTWKRDAASTHILTGIRGRPWIGTHLSQSLGRALVAIGLPPGLNVHGLRKAAAARLADAGCSTHEIAAITGHRTLAMVALYTASADQERLAGAAISRLERKK